VRTADIATRAGVNPQLISYYFDGKQGLLDELRRRWQQTLHPSRGPGTVRASPAVHDGAG
jgi:AcrR family transcriptional regulator